MSITSSQKANMQSLSSFGSSKADFVETGKMTEVEQIMAAYAMKFIETAQINLRTQDKVSTGDLLDIQFEVGYMGKSFVLTLGYEKGSKAAEYWDFVNKGVAGYGKQLTGSPYKFKSPYANKKMAGAILMWIRKNGIRPVEKKTTVSSLERKRKSIRAMADSAKSVKQLAYAISTKIKREGIKPSRYFDYALQMFKSAQFQKDLSEAVGFEVQVAIKNSWENK
jgi:hypothetical protein